ncbi:MAG: cell division protein FtsZ, partial [Gammaproteobacteria bacterium]
NNIRECVDTLLIINNDKLRDLYGNLGLTNAFGHADNVLATAAKGIAEIITNTGMVNVDFQDVRTVMNDSGVALMGSAEAEGDDRSITAAQAALASPLLNDNDIKGAKYVLLNITYGDKEVLMDEVTEITDHIQDAAGLTADVIWGYGNDESLGDKLRVTIIATGFDLNPDTGIGEAHVPEKTYVPLGEDRPTEITQPIGSPTGSVVEDQGSGSMEEMQKEDPSEQEEPYMKPDEKDEFEIPQTSIEFEINTPTEETEETPEPPAEVNSEGKIVHMLEEDDGDDNKQVIPENVQSLQGLSTDEQRIRAEERVNRVKEMSIRLRTPSGLADLENEPAYKRKNVELQNVPHSSESELSKYTLSDDVDENGERKAGLRPDNPFLNTNVD